MLSLLQLYIESVAARAPATDSRTRCHRVLYMHRYAESVAVIYRVCCSYIESLLQLKHLQQTRYTAAADPTATDSIYGELCSIYTYAWICRVCCSYIESLLQLYIEPVAARAPATD